MRPIWGLQAGLHFGQDEAGHVRQIQAEGLAQTEPPQVLHLGPIACWSHVLERLVGIGDEEARIKALVALGRCDGAGEEVQWAEEGGDACRCKAGPARIECPHG